MKKLATAIASLTASCCAAADQPPADRTPTMYVQAWLGALNTRDGWTLKDPQTQQNASGDLGTLPYGGGAAQSLWGSGPWHIGYEAGGLASWKNDNTEFFGASGGGGSTLAIKTENTFFSLGVFMGAVGRVDLTSHVHVVLAAGPSLTWARLNRHNDEPPTARNDTIVVAAGDSASDVSFVPYARAGLEVELSSGLTFGASVRYANDRFDFGRGGELDVDEVLWLITIGSRL